MTYDDTIGLLSQYLEGKKYHEIYYARLIRGKQLNNWIVRTIVAKKLCLE